MLKKNVEKAERKERRFKAGTFQGFRPHSDKLRVKYDRKVANEETRRRVREEAFV